MTTINVVATIKAKAGKEKELENVLTSLVMETHKEPGCLTYALHRSVNNAATFIFVEKWASETALNSHLQSPHIAKAMAQKEALIESLDIAPLISMTGAP